MARNTSEKIPPPPVVSEFKCPNCGDANVYYQESTPTVCDVKIVGGALHIDAGSYNYIFESATANKDTALLCKSCVHEFPVPDGMTVEWV